MDGKIANPVTKKIMLGYIHISNDISYKPIEGIFLNAKLFVSNTNVEKFNSFDYGLEVLSDSILIKEINEEVFS